MKEWSIILAASVLALVISASGASGQAAEEKPAGSQKSAAPRGDQWEFSVTPYFWATQLDNKVTVRGHTATSTIQFHEIWDALEGAFLGHFEAMKGERWGFFADAIYLKLRDSGTLKAVRPPVPPPPIRELTVTTDTWIVEVGGLYRIGRWPLEGKSGQAVTVDFLGGARYWYFGVDLDTGGGINPSDNDQWVDPFFGARVKVDLTKELSLNLRGDIGGFGVGSDFSWNGVGTFGYRFSPTFTGELGYRALYVNYKRSASNARYKETFQGPLAALTIKW